MKHEFIKTCESNGIVYWTMKIEVEVFGSFAYVNRYYRNFDGSWKSAKRGKGIRRIFKVKTDKKGSFVVVEKEKYYLPKGE